MNVKFKKCDVLIPAINMVSPRTMILKQDWIILSVFYRYPQECLINKEPEDKLAFLSVWSCLYGRKISHKKHPVNVSLVSNIYGAVQLAYLEFVYSLYAWTDFISFNLFGDHDRISTLRRCLHIQ
jgi:hypothetical protein